MRATTAGQSWTTRCLPSAPLCHTAVSYYGLYEEGRPGWLRAQAAVRELSRMLQADGTQATLILLLELHEPRSFGTFADV